MSRYGAAISRSGINTADNAWWLIAGSASGRLAVVRIVVNIAVAPTTAPAWYLARTTTRSGTPVATLAGQAYDVADAASLGVFESCGGTQPTFTAANKIDSGGLA